MKLNKNPFDKIKNKTKTIELRLFDEKRQLIELDDIIEFSNIDNLSDKIKVEVIGLFRYSSFRDLLSDFDMSYFGYPLDYPIESFLEGMRNIYSESEEQKYVFLVLRLS